MKLWDKSKNSIWRRYKPLLMPPNAEKMGTPVTSTTVPPEKKMSESGTMPWERGWSLHHKSKSDLQFPASPGGRHPGSQSFIPSKPHSNSRSSTPGQSCQRDSTPHTSRKQPVAWPPRPTEVTLTQSPAQKTPKLKSIVQRVPATKNYQDPPYKSLKTDPREFIRYLIGNLDQKAYNAEIRCLAAFYSQAMVLAHRVIVSTITTLAAANRGVHFLVPFILRVLMNSLPNPSDAEPPGPPAHSEDYQTDIRVHYVREWMYLMHLLQYLYEAGSVYTNGGSCQTGKQANAVCLLLDQCHAEPIWHFYMAAWGHGQHMLWLSYYQACTWPEQRITDYESHLHVIKGLEILWNWLRNRYLVEAMVEGTHLTLHGGSLDRLPFPHSYKGQQPGNEGPFYRSRGICPSKVESTPENAPRVANTMLEALACHNCHQTKARDCQEYQRQQDNTESPDGQLPFTYASGPGWTHRSRWLGGHHRSPITCLALPPQHHPHLAPPC